jgi:hypothetical protein
MTKMNTLRRFSRLIACVSVAWLATGCATSQRMSEADKAKISEVTVSVGAEKGQVFLMAPSGANVGLMFGAVGGALSGASMAGAQIQFDDFLAKHNIAIDKIVAEEVAAAIQASGKAKVSQAPDAGLPTVKVTVPQYGFGVTHLLSSNVVPVLQVKCEMVDAAGKVIWSASDRMLPSIASPMDALAWSQIANNPQLIEAELRKASKHLANQLVKSL